MKISINKLAFYTGKTRETIRRRLHGLPFCIGPKQAKLYESGRALAAIYDAPYQPEIPDGEATGSEES